MWAPFFQTRAGGPLLSGTLHGVCGVNEPGHGGDLPMPSSRDSEYFWPWGSLTKRGGLCAAGILAGARHCRKQGRHAQIPSWPLKNNLSPRFSNLSPQSSQVQYKNPLKNNQSPGFGNLSPQLHQKQFISPLKIIQSPGFSNISPQSSHVQYKNPLKNN